MMDSADRKTCRDEVRRQIRQQWFAVGVVVLLQFVAIAGLSAAIIRDHQRIDDQIVLLERNRAGTLSQTVQGCQRGNELRRAVLTIRENQAARTGAFGNGGVSNQAIDPDAVALFDCRQTTIRVTGQDPGPVSDFVE